MLIEFRISSRFCSIISHRSKSLQERICCRFASHCTPEMYPLSRTANIRASTEVQWSLEGTIDLL